MSLPAASVPELRPLHVLCLFAVAAVWGTNFVVIKEGIREFDPLLFAALRFAFAAFPLILLRPRPGVPLLAAVANGLAVGVGQFGLMFLAMDGQISPGLASLLVQVQVFLTVLLSAIAFNQRVGLRPLLGLVLGAAGMIVVATHLDATITAVGLVMILAAAACWAASNILTQRLARMQAAKGHPLDMLTFVIWSSACTIPPLVAMAWLRVGADALWHQLGSASIEAWAAALWQGWGNMLFGFALWYAMLARYGSALVAPWALLVPVFGLALSVIVEGEAMPGWKLLAIALVMAGLAVANGLVARLFGRLRHSAR